MKLWVLIRSWVSRAVAPFLFKYMVVRYSAVDNARMVCAREDDELKVFYTIKELRNTKMSSVIEGINLKQVVDLFVIR